MTDSRTPPKFVPTLTEVAAQEQEPVFDAVLHPRAAQVRPDPLEQPAQPPTRHRAPAEQGEAAAPDVFRLRRGEAEPGGAEAMPSDAAIASLPTSSGWAQALPPAAEPAVAAPVPPDPERFRVDTETMPPTPPLAVPVAAEPEPAAAVHVSSHGTSGEAAMEAATAQLVASAAATAQALEEAITRRVLRHVQETLDERLSAAVLKVVEQQTALFQSSLQLEIDTSIRAAVATAVQQVLRAEGAEPAARPGGHPAHRNN